MPFGILFNTIVYVQRHAALLDAMAGHDGVVFLPGHASSPVNYPANCYPFRQDSTFLYFFGHDVPELAATVDLESGQIMLWGAEASMDDIIWSGPVPSMPERAERVNAVWGGDNTALAAYLQSTEAKNRIVHYLPPYRAETREQLNGLLAPGHAPSPALIHAVIHTRSKKTAEEIVEIEKALAISHTMYTTAFGMARPGVTEQALYGALCSIVAASGAGTPAFQTILSVRGETLHNHAYPHTLQAGQLLLIDSGAESLRRYASDITRTLPVSGCFTPRQKALYETVLRAQEVALAHCIAGQQFVDAHLAAATVMVEGLKDMGLMRGHTEDAVTQGAHALFFPHGLGHMLGLDVHDMENLGEDHVGYTDELSRSKQFGLRSLRLARALQPGFTVTIEPGLYFIPELVRRWQRQGLCEQFINYDTVVQWIGLGGIRIEDDVLITEQGPRVLGPPIPKTVQDIENAMQG